MYGSQDNKVQIICNKHKINLSKEENPIGTWNIVMLYDNGKLFELQNELGKYRWDSIGLAEIRWTCCGETITDEGHEI